MTGELSKVEIRVYEDQSYRKQVGRFELPINPEQFSQQFQVNYDQEQAAGSQGNDPRFKFTKPEELKLDFVFDGTGVVPKKGTDGFHKDVTKQVEDFLAAVYTMNSSTHKPNFLRLLWGDFSFGNRNGFDCILKDLSITYPLFDPSGKPLRAKLSATFLNYIEQVRRVREEGKNSPDVTHLRKVKEKDSLPLMAHNIYGDAAYYLQVAKVNGLVNFRRLRTNQDLRFPPIDTSAS